MTEFDDSGTEFDVLDQEGDDPTFDPSTDYDNGWAPGDGGEELPSLEPGTSLFDLIDPSPAEPSAGGGILEALEDILGGGDSPTDLLGGDSPDVPGGDTPADPWGDIVTSPAPVFDPSTDYDNGWAPGDGGEYDPASDPDVIVE